jgi:glutamine phosphoribosylpyrophosphate amidotransferase
MAFIRNHYVGRSFLQPSQLIRDFNVRVKLNLIGELVAGKRVIIVDDSIVRGTTCKARVKTLKDAGAKEVHVRVSCPPHMHSCVYGIDFPDRNKLMAANHSVEAICAYLNADSLHYLSPEGMVKGDRIAEGKFLSRVLGRQLSRGLRSDDRQGDHRTPAQSRGSLAGFAGQGQFANPVAVNVAGQSELKTLLSGAFQRGDECFGIFR